MEGYETSTVISSGWMRLGGESPARAPPPKKCADKKEENATAYANNNTSDDSSGNPEPGGFGHQFQVFQELYSYGTNKKGELTLTAGHHKQWRS